MGGGVAVTAELSARPDAAARWARRTAGLALAYFVAGYLCSRLTAPPRIASVVWPPAGIALAMTMLWGRRALAGIAIGSALLNTLLVAQSHTVPLAESLPLGSLVGVGALAQAGVGAAVLRRVLGPGNPLEAGRETIVLLLVGGAVSCLVNPTWSVLMLALTGPISGSRALVSWLDWWVGDAIGVWLFTPMILAWMARPREVWRRRWREVAAPLAVTAVALVTVFLAVTEAERVDREQAFQDDAHEVAAMLDRDLGRTMAVTETAAQVFGMADAAEPGRFGELADPWLRVSGTVAAMGWAPIVPDAERSAFETRLRSIGGTGIHELAPDGSPVPAAGRPYYVPLFLRAPLTTHLGALGFDLASDPARATALAQARDTGALAATATLAAPPSATESAVREAHVLLVMPVFAMAGAPGTVEAREHAIRGYVVSVVVPGQVVRNAVTRAGAAGVEVRLVDTTDAPPRLLWSSGAPIPRDAMVATTVRTVGGRRYRCEVWSLYPSTRSWLGWTVLVGGLAFSGLVAGLALDSGARAAKVERLVAERTAELERANAALQRSNLDLQRFAYVASHDMREPLRAIASFSELLSFEEAEGLGTAGRDYLRRILAAARRVQILVTEMVEFARVDNRPVPMREVPLESAVGAAVENLHTSISECGATIHVGDLPTVLCDQVQIALLFQNLLANALEFRRPDVPPDIAVTARRTHEGWEIAVRDNGIGIDARHQERIFEIFQRLSGTENKPGRGIGLATCRRIVERHGGRIWVRSAPGSGSTFFFTLPFPEAPHSERGPAHEPA
jgi:signal transduction histidine kinase/integral membrane sensor domain MASE1